MDPKLFIGETVLAMVKDGITVRLHPGEHVTGEDGLACGGWFDPRGRSSSVPWVGKIG